MSEQRFLELLQALLTMVDPKDPTSVACVKNTITNVCALGIASKKVDSITIRMMKMAEMDCEYLINSKNEFAGVPGDYKGNELKRRQLGYALRPHC